jgi:ElaA protein
LVSNDPNESSMNSSSGLEWRLKPFLAMSVQELYELLQLRTEVFVMEQNCVFQDMDGADQQAFHLLGFANGQLLAYARCFPAGIKFSEASIGRVVTRSLKRGQGLGHQLIDQAIASVCASWGPQAIRIGAQARLADYYAGHGFVDMGLPYMEDGIPHLEMLWQPGDMEPR